METAIGTAALCRGADSMVGLAGGAAAAPGPVERQDFGRPAVAVRALRGGPPGPGVRPIAATVPQVLRRVPAEMGLTTGAAGHAVGGAKVGEDGAAGIACSS